MKVSYIPIAKARGFTTRLITSNFICITNTAEISNNHEYFIRIYIYSYINRYFSSIIVTKQQQNTYNT